MFVLVELDLLEMETRVQVRLYRLLVYQPKWTRSLRKQPTFLDTTTSFHAQNDV